MSSLLRRTAVVSLTALALATGVGATSAVAAVPGQAPAVLGPGPDDFGGGNGRGHDRPLHFGPFEFPRNGTISGGFSWGTR
ncbi:hypothetical protein AB0K93_13830 [Streptomyces sp. NPDC052676]|uniref:hypothetical protein n=1 Tax=Streptomyces sp. NPDC052676 TaxID=3154953 RepID=UPI003437B521